MRRALVCLVFMVAAATGASDDTLQGEDMELEQFDQLWDYSDPAATEAKFRALLPEAAAAGDASVHAQLLTQIARTQGLQRQFEAAHGTLDQVEAMLTEDMAQARVRYLLERGRAYNSSGDKEAARPLFLEAWELAQANGLDFYAVDAAHMLGIVDSGQESLEWNRLAMELAEASTEERARGWLGSLYNNIGWTYHDMGEYEQALVIFEKALAWREERGAAGPIRIARWCVARTQRSLGRYELALALQETLLADMTAAGADPDGYVYEELGECLLALDRQEEARANFARAYELLSPDPWLAANESDRLARLKELGQVE